MANLKRRKKENPEVTKVDPSVINLNDICTIQFDGINLYTVTDVTKGYIGSSKFGNGIILDDRMVEIEHPDNGQIYVISLRIVHKMSEQRSKKSAPKRMSLEDLKKQMAQAAKK